MKKITNEIRLKDAIYNHRALQKHLKEKNYTLKHKRIQFVTPTKLVKLPVEISLDTSKCRDELLHVIELLHEKAKELRNRQQVKNKKLKVDFTAVNLMVAAGTLLLMAELRNMANIYPDVRLECVSPRSNRNKQVLIQLGFQEFMRGVKKVDTSRQDVVNWRVARGVKANAQECGNIIMDCVGTAAPSLAKPFFRAVTEAMTNTVQHAYIENIPLSDFRPVASDKEGWWMFSQEIGDEITMVFCDLGHGIPNTLPVRHPGLMEYIESETMLDKAKEKVKHTLLSDASIIAGIIDKPYTRTKAPHRGLGLLKDICGFINSIGNSGRVNILSNKGQYESIKDGNKRESTPRNHKKSIHGTLIALHVRVSTGGE